MFIDHCAVVLLYGLLKAARMAVPDIGTLLYRVYENRHVLADLYNAMRTIGRLAFPLYCFLLVQSVMHTRSMPRYVLRMLVFALISEVPYDLAFNGALLEWHDNNVFFTLLLGLLTLWGIQAFSRLLERLPLSFSVRQAVIWLAAAVIAIPAGILAEESVLSSDYGHVGIIVIVIMYLFRAIPAISYGLGTLALAILLKSDITFFALMGLLPVLFYRGQRGKGSKYFFYLFYPAHLLLLAGIAALLPI